MHASCAVLTDVARFSAPWMVDPALFVRVFADAIHDQGALDELEAHSSPHTSPRSSPKVQPRGEAPYFR